MRFLRSFVAFFALAILISCSPGGSGRTDPIRDQTESAPPGTITAVGPVWSGSHLQFVARLTLDPSAAGIEIIPDRSVMTHLDLAYFWKYYGYMLSVKVLGHDPVGHKLTVRITFTNPLGKELRDIRAIFPKDSDIVPITIDGWSVRGGAPASNPDPYFAFGLTYPNRAIAPGDSDSREIVFYYKPPLSLKNLTFVLDATVEKNTAEPYQFGQAALTGRFFHVAMSDWQDDITTAVLDTRPCGLIYPLRLASFGQQGEWGTSIPDIAPGNYRLLLTAESPESPGEIGEGEPAVAVTWVDLHWPPDGPLVPISNGHGIYGYSFIDPDTNLPPTDANAFVDRFRNDMGGDWLIMEYGEICNSGYLAMNAWVPQYVYWLHNAAPDLPIHLNLDNLGFVAPANDPCQHVPENYTDAFFNHLLESIRGQIFENPQFDCVSGLHFDIEIFPGSYTEDQLFIIYKRYADFLARLHLEAGLRGRNITVYEFDRHPHKVVGDLAYLCTTDAFLGEVYFDRFTWDWDPKEYATSFLALKKIMGMHRSWAMEYGRPYYPVLGTFSGWIDAYKDTLGSITVCPGQYLLLIDEHCFGKGPLHTINEFDIVKAKDIHGKLVERVILYIDSGEPIFPSNGFAVYLLGDDNPNNIADDTVFCRTAYAMAKALRSIQEVSDPLVRGIVTFRYENNSYWKAGAYADPLGRGDITAVSGQIRFGDGLEIQKHPELWGLITIELLDPLTPEVLNHPCYRTSIDIVGIADGSYIFPDLPRGKITIRAVAPGWESDPVTLNMDRNFAYKDHVDLILKPK